MKQKSAFSVRQQNIMGYFSVGDIVVQQVAVKQVFRCTVLEALEKKSLSFYTRKFIHSAGFTELHSISW